MERAGQGENSRTGLKKQDRVVIAGQGGNSRTGWKELDREKIAGQERIQEKQMMI